MSQMSGDGRGLKGREDDGLHEKLRAGLQGGRIQLFTDSRMIDFEGSPVHCHWDHLLPLTGLMTLALVILLAGGIVVGIIAMTLFVMVYLLGNRYYVSWRLRTRTIEYLCRDAAHVQALWRLGGIALVVPGTGEPPCVAPKGDWRKFIRRHFGDAVPAAERMANAPVPLAEPPAPVPPVPPVAATPADPAGFAETAPEIALAPSRAAADATAPAEPVRPVSPPPGARWESILDEEKPPRDEVVP